MEIINLVPYIQEGLFLQHDKLPYDLIVREKIPQDASVMYTHKVLSDLGYDFGVSGQLSALSTTYPRILLVSETINALYLLPRLSSLPAEAQVTVLQIGAGIAGYMSKSGPDMSDITAVMPYAHVQEVYDRVTLLTALSKAGKNYIRIPRGETPAVMFEKAPAAEGGIADLKDHGFEGGAGTIIAPGGTLIQAIHALQQLQNDGKFFDLFALLDYDFTIAKSLKESIIKTENIILLLDQQRRTIYESVIKAKLRDAGLVDTTIHFVYPNTDTINTILPEYLREQANRDGEGIAEKLNSLN